MNKRNTFYGISPYNPPKSLITENQYRDAVDALAGMGPFGIADEAYFEKLEDLRNDLYDMIVYNTDTLKGDGTVYYVSNAGSDDNNGLTPETAWGTLQKVTDTKLSHGDTVLFERGGHWRGNVILQSGVTYSAYGTGPKPKIHFAYDGKTYGEWVQTDMPNIWVLDKEIPDRDIGLILFNGGESYAEKKNEFSSLKQDYDYMFNCELSNEEVNDRKIYMYSSNGNPAEIFDKIDLSRAKSTIAIPGRSRDITVHNLEIAFGQDYFFAGATHNIKMLYCSVLWMGGNLTGRGGVRFGGGGGCWCDCDVMEFKYCYFTQHFDTAVTPQYNYDKDERPSLFDKFAVTGCLIEYTEYSFEYFMSQKNRTDNLFRDMYFGYNFCRLGGQGFGDKTQGSAYIKSWQGHENYSKNCLFEKNIFDRAAALSINMASLDAERNFSFELLPKMRANVYIEPRDKEFALVNGVRYKFNEEGHKSLEDIGFETEAVYMFTK